MSRLHVPGTGFTETIIQWNMPQIALIQQCIIVLCRQSLCKQGFDHSS